MNPLAVRLSQAVMIAQRLERLSADSTWAHASSGHRGSLLKLIERLESGTPDLSAAEWVQVDALIARGFDLLAAAAREIGDPELLRGLSRPESGDLRTGKVG